MEQKKARIGIIGCGQIVKIRHAPELADCEWAEPAGFYDFFPERAAEYVKQYGGRVYASSREMLNDPKVDGVVICTANNAHAALACEALAAGKYVLCEKLMATTMEDAAAVVRAEAQADTFFMAAHNQRFTLGHRMGKKLLDSGKMGKVLSFRCTLAHAGPERFSVYRSNSTWYFDKAASGLGCVSDLGIHKCDILMHLLGEPFETVGAVAGTRHKRGADGKLAEIYDNAVCVLQTRSGVMGTLNLSYTNYSGMENATVYYCENGVLRVHCSPNCALEVIMDGGETVRYMDVPQPRSGIMEAFTHAIVTGGASPVPAVEAERALQTVFAIDEAARGKKIVRIGGKAGK